MKVWISQTNSFFDIKKSFFRVIRFYTRDERDNVMVQIVGWMQCEFCLVMCSEMHVLVLRTIHVNSENPLFVYHEIYKWIGMKVYLKMKTTINIFERTFLNFYVNLLLWTANRFTCYARGISLLKDWKCSLLNFNWRFAHFSAIFC